MSRCPRSIWSLASSSESKSIVFTELVGCVMNVMNDLNWHWVGWEELRLQLRHLFGNLFGFLCIFFDIFVFLCNFLDSFAPFWHSYGSFASFMTVFFLSLCIFGNFLDRTPFASFWPPLHLGQSEHQLVGLECIYCEANWVWSRQINHLQPPGPAAQIIHQQQCEERERASGWNWEGRMVSQTKGI